MKKIKDWEQWEEDIAELFHGKRQSGSGAPALCKGDVKTANYLIECKQTSSGAYRLSIDTWRKIEDEARNMFLIPLFACRSKAGDFIVGRPFDIELESTDSIKIKKDHSVLIKEKCQLILDNTELNVFTFNEIEDWLDEMEE